FQQPGLQDRLHTTGNPVRREIAALPVPAERFAGRSGPLRLLVLGGSLGAVALNEAVPQMLAAFPADQRPQVLHQSGKRNLEEAQRSYQQCQIALNENCRLLPFIDDMALAYAEADLVICRAGATTVCELAAAGVASILVPYPHAVDDHQ